MRRLLSVGLVGLLSACGPKSDPVRDALDRMTSAANSRDTGALFERVAADFQAADGSGRADAEATVHRYFAAYEILNVSIRDVQIEHGANAARVRLRTAVSGQPRRIGGVERLVPSSATYDFDLRLVSDGGKWKVAWAQWNPAGSSSP